MEIYEKYKKLLIERCSMREKIKIDEFQEDIDNGKLDIIFDIQTPIIYNILGIRIK